MKKYFVCIILFWLSCAQGAKQTQATVQAIIFDIHGVLFEEDSVAFAKKVGLGAISSYTLSHWKNPVNTCLDVLEHMSKEDHQIPSMKFTFKDRQMPRCIVEWQCGHTSYNQVHQELCSYWNHLDEKNHFKSANEREITQTIVHVALDPQGFSDIAKPNQATLKLIRELKKKGYKLYLAGNMPKEPYEMMLKNTPEIKELFDGIHVSSHVGFTKPNAKMFNHIAKEHKIHPSACLVIDDEKENTQAAQEIGMQSILFSNAKQTEKVLKKNGIL